MTDELPVFRGREARRELVRRYGLPNAAPRPGESLFGRCREVFVDDDNDGRPVAYWVPDSTEEKNGRLHDPRNQLPDMTKPDDGGFDLIHTYTRAEAIADGVLVDVTKTARQAGYRYPVALTRAVWERCVTVPEGLEGVQDEVGRLWDVLWMGRAAAMASPADKSIVHFRLYVRSTLSERFTGKDLVSLKAVCGPGDSGEPVVTIMLPEED